ncbi:2-dehydro-3-deoxyphosphogalactonate aldolase [Bosea sp. BE125]|uniref:2-dehydro-3-deoxy-6-phosphogalactonate aldolase n=1 Tax=Bosea sp. BE125 TaxID=2817909 RepID=UPI00286775E7|nr:2-dehydro-3-deoxy-6-phosphogalactonate aldolase [Bosea sp. BE125]MDR6869256.1 2-dehydro-3-deoxyphosphogalactonate aldolase [Bosea sp. BE125]
MSFHDALRAFPFIAILRGVKPDEVVGLTEELIAAGFRIVEVPLNSPEPLRSIEALARAFPDILIGAGTVMSADAVASVQQAGGRLILMPHSDGAVVRAAKERALTCVPGVATPTEAFAALANGADALKMFPAEQMPPAVVGAWRAVLPAGTLLVPVGGISADKVEAYRKAGAGGFGLGSALYKPGMTREQIRTTAQAFAQVSA